MVWFNERENIMSENERQDVNLANLCRGDAMSKVDDAIKKVIADILARPEILVTRTVSLTISVSHKAEGPPESRAIYPMYSASVSHKIPNQQIDSQPGYFKGDKALLSSQYVSNPKQMGIDEVTGDQEQDDEDNISHFNRAQER